MPPIPENASQAPSGSTKLHSTNCVYVPVGEPAVIPARPITQSTQLTLWNYGQFPTADTSRLICRLPTFALRSIKYRISVNNSVYKSFTSYCPDYWACWQTAIENRSRTMLDKQPAQDGGSLTAVSKPTGNKTSVAKARHATESSNRKSNRPVSPKDSVFLLLVLPNRNR